jgi:thymidylate kinase
MAGLPLTPHGVGSGEADPRLVEVLLDGLSNAGVEPRLLHSGFDDKTGTWRGDIDLIVQSAPEQFFPRLREVSRRLGFVPVLQLPRVFNTIEVDLVFPGSTSWTVVLAQEDGGFLNLDVVLTTREVRAAQVGEDVFGAFAIGTDLRSVYLAIKRLRKHDLGRDSWSRVPSGEHTLAELLSPYVGRRIASALGSSVERHGAPDPLTAREAERALRRRRSLSIDGLRAAAKGLGALGRRTTTPGGAFIAFAGVDGAGKSAVAGALAGWSPFRRVRRLHSRPALLKPPGWFLGRHPADGSDPHGKEPWGSWMSTIRLVYLWTDYSLGYWLRIWPVRARGGLVISERWWWDMYVDPLRHRMKAMPRFVRVLGALIPSPDLTVFLDATSESVLDRKQELDADEIVRQRRAWTESADHIPHFCAVDADAPLTSVSTGVIRSLVDRQGERIERNGPATSLGLQSAPDTSLVSYPPSEPRVVARRGEAESAAEYVAATSPPARLRWALAAKPILGRVLWKPLDFSTRAAWERGLRYFDDPDQPITGVLSEAGPLQRLVLIPSREELVAKIPLREGGVVLNERERAALSELRNTAWHALGPRIHVKDDLAAADGVLLTERVVGHHPRWDDAKVQLELLHKLGGGLHHGDVTPWNVLVREGGLLVLVDWESTDFSAHASPLCGLLDFILRGAVVARARRGRVRSVLFAALTRSDQTRDLADVAAEYRSYRRRVRAMSVGRPDGLDSRVEQVLSSIIGA